MACMGKCPYGLTFAASPDATELRRFSLVVPQRSWVIRVSYDPFVVARK
jgi:hypothetical protein